MIYSEFIKKDYLLAPNEYLSAPFADGKGSDLYWKIDDGVLIITTLDIDSPSYIKNYYDAILDERPWAKHNNEIVKAIVDLEFVPTGLLKEMDVKSVTFTERCKEFGDNCMSQCRKLKNVNIMACVEKMGINLCNGCNNLENFNIKGLEVLPTGTLTGTSIKDLKLPANLTAIENMSIVSPYLNTIEFKSDTLGTSLEHVDSNLWRFNPALETIIGDENAYEVIKRDAMLGVDSQEKSKDIFTKIKFVNNERTVAPEEHGSGGKDIDYNRFNEEIY